MIHSGPTQKYMLYAIGEIMLVVVGILIALQINNWNEERKTNRRALEYRQKLITDLVHDTININAVLQQATGIQNRIQSYMTYFESGDKTVEQLLDSALQVGYQLFRYLPINYTFRDMQSSGNTSLLREDERRTLLELTKFQEFTEIIMDRNINVFFDDKQEVKRYLDMDMLETDFFSVTNTELHNQDKAIGLRQLHHLLSSNNDIAYILRNRATRIKELTKKAINLLQQ